MSGLEIERKFLVRSSDYKRLAHKSYRIKQGYICSGGGKTVRVRQRDDQGFLTIKGPSPDGGLSRYEFEREIPVDDAKAMLTLCRGGLIEKTRYLIPFAGHTFEVDEFHGANDGLIFAEVELGSADEAFEKPDFLGPEVTGNSHFYNKHLLRDSYPNWKNEVPEAFR